MKQEELHLEPLDFSLDSLVCLAEEYWIFKKNLEDESLIKSLPRLLRKLESFLKEQKIELLDLEGKRYDPGMHVEIIHQNTYEESSEILIEEMITPVIFWNDSVVNYGKVVLSGPKKEENNEKPI